MDEAQLDKLLAPRWFRFAGEHLLKPSRTSPKVLARVSRTGNQWRTVVPYHASTLHPTADAAKAHA